MTKVPFSWAPLLVVILILNAILFGTPLVGWAASSDHVVERAIHDGLTQGDSVSETPWVDLSLTETMEPSRPREGETVTFTLTVTNAGPGDATGIVITNTLPSGFSYLSSDGGGVYTPANATITWQVPNLPAQGTLTFHFSARTEKSFNHTSLAEIIAADQPDVDSTPGNHDFYEDDLAYAAPQVVIYRNSQLGDLVWWDVDQDGLQDPDEPGIPYVQLTLIDDQGHIQTTVTDENGVYHFSPLFPGTYTVTVDASNFQPGGALAYWTPTSVHQGDDIHDSDGDPLTHSASLTLSDNENNMSLDFGFKPDVRYRISQQRHVLDPLRPGQEISFTVIITNTGHTWLTAIPLQDRYNPDYLGYGNGTDFAVPDSVDHADDGVLDWPNILNAPLAPGESVTATLYFTAQSDTQALPDSATVNMTIAYHVQADPDGPGGPLASRETPSSQADSHPVRILAPTGVILTDFRAYPMQDHIQLVWDTASEFNLLGFSLVREDINGQETLLTSQLIPAKRPGLAQGAHYTFLDTPQFDRVYRYILRIHTLDGRQIALPPVTTVPSLSHSLLLPKSLP